MKSAAARASRIRRLRARKLKGAVKIFTTGLQPAATYGAEVVGVPDKDLKKLQDIAASTLKPSTRGRSRAALFVAHGDPTWRPSVAPVVRWCQELWWASFPKAKPVPALPTEFLEEAWKRAMADPPKAWSGSRGAVDAAILSARRVGWKFVRFAP